MMLMAIPVALMGFALNTLKMSPTIVALAMIVTAVGLCWYEAKRDNTSRTE
jgi:undecaprenyl pyrophosphate phosphatase UppP